MQAIQTSETPAAQVLRAPRVRTSEAWWQQALRRFVRQRLSVVAAVLLLLLGLAALLAPWLAPHDPLQQYRREGFTAGNLPVGPNATFWLGTDGLGRDMFSRIIHGARVSLTVGLVGSVLSVLLGVLVGGTAALVGGRVDAALMRFVDMVMSLPTLLVILLFIVIFGPGLWITIAVIALLGWTYPARVFRAEVLSIRQRDFITAAQCLGIPVTRIFTHHILPQILALIVIYIGLGVPSAIFTEATLGFLGLGIPPPAPSWGSMINTGTAYYRASPQQVIIPGLAIVLTVICCNLVGSGLRDALDPTVRDA